MAGQAKRFTIAAERDSVPRSETRVMIGSAMVLADRWAAEGWKNVRVTDLDGAVLTRDALRSRLRAGKSAASLVAHSPR